MNIKKILKAAEEKKRAIVRKKMLKAAEEKNRATVAKIKKIKSRKNNLCDEEGGKILTRRQGYIVPKPISITLPSIGQEGAFRPQSTRGIIRHMKSGTSAKTYTQAICLKKTVKPKTKIKGKKLDPVTYERLNKIWIKKQSQMGIGGRRSRGRSSNRQVFKNELYREKGRIIPMIKRRVSTNSLNDSGLLILLMSCYLNQDEKGWQYLEDKLPTGSYKWFESNRAKIWEVIKVVREDQQISD